MKQDELKGLLKTAKIIDNSELFSRVQIIYSEVAQVLSALNGRAAQGVDGYVGVCENHLVLFENTLFGGKPKAEIFRVPLDQIDDHSIKNNLFGITKSLRVKIQGKKFKLTCPSKYKEALANIAKLIK